MDPTNLFYIVSTNGIYKELILIIFSALSDTPVFSKNEHTASSICVCLLPSRLVILIDELILVVRSREKHIIPT